MLAWCPTPIHLPGVKVQDVYSWDAGVLYYYDAPIKRGK